MFDDLDMDVVFRALADASRRRMLDMLRSSPGLTVNEIAAVFSFSRYAAMKHLRSLEDASLIATRRVGRTKEHYLNTIPIQLIHDRWMSAYSARWARSLTALKHQLESEDSPMKEQLRHMYQVYIRTTPEKLWHALTDPDMTELYFHGTRVEGTFAVGETIRYLFSKDGELTTALECTIKECLPGKRLVHDFRFHSNGDPPSRVTWEIEPLGDVVKLTVVHDGFDSETETYTSVRQGWPPIFSGLKTLLETGEPLVIPSAATEHA